MKNFNIKNTLIALACTLVFTQANAMEQNPFTNLSIEELFAQLSIEDTQNTTQINFMKQRIVDEIRTSIRINFILDDKGNILEGSDKSIEGRLSQLDDIIIIRNQILEARKILLDPELAIEELLILQKPLNSTAKLMPFIKLKYLETSIEIDAPRVLNFLIQNLPAHFINIAQLMDKAEEEKAQNCLSFLEQKSAEARSKSKRRIDEVQGKAESQDREKR